MFNYSNILYIQNVPNHINFTYLQLTLLSACGTQGNQIFLRAHKHMQLKKIYGTLSFQNKNLQN